MLTRASLVVKTSSKSAVLVTMTGVMTGNLASRIVARSNSISFWPASTTSPAYT